MTLNTHLMRTWSRRVARWVPAVAVGVTALLISNWIQLQLLDETPCRDVIFQQAACVAPTTSPVWNIASLIVGGSIGYGVGRRFAR